MMTRLKGLIILVVIFLTFGHKNEHLSHYCIHDTLNHTSYKDTKVISKWDAINAMKMAQKSNNIDNTYMFAGEPANLNDFSAINIGITTTKLQSDWASVPTTLNYYVNDVIPAAVDYLQKIINVRPVDGALIFDGNVQTCGPSTEGNTIPSIMVSTGSNNDFELYISGVNTNNCGGATYGYASSCIRNNNDRPIAGYMNLCYNVINIRPLSWEEAVTLIVHEALHALGWSSSLFNVYRQFNNNQLNIYNPEITRTVRGVSKKLFAGTNVVEKAKTFYGCNTNSIEGVELEEFGSDGTAGSHWEARTVGSATMLGYIGTANPVHLFTFALLEDTGWYTVNYEYASEPPIGRGAGCSFVENKCITGSINNPTIVDSSVYCAVSVSNGCGRQHVLKGHCTITGGKSGIPTQMQYYGSSSIGGNFYNDYCGTFEGYSNGECRSADAGTLVQTSVGGDPGLGSKCAVISGSGQSITVCYKSRCLTDYQGTYIGVSYGINNQAKSSQKWVACYAGQEGTTIDIGSQFSGYTYTCPNYLDLCYDANPYICNGHGRLSNGVCKCTAGYMGTYCSVEATADNVAANTDDTDALNVCSNSIGTFDSDSNVGRVTVTLTLNSVSITESLLRTAIQNYVSIAAEVKFCDTNIASYSGQTTITAEVDYYSARSKPTSTELESALTSIKSRYFGNTISVDTTVVDTPQGIVITGEPTLTPTFQTLPPTFQTLPPTLQTLSPLVNPNNSSSVCVTTPMNLVLILISLIYCVVY